MIIVHGTFPIRAEVRDDAISLMREMVVASRSEYGCVSYEFYVGLTDPNTLLLFQEWESVEALQGHYETDHMEDFLKALPEVLDGEITTRRYEVRSSQDDEPDEEDDLMAPPSTPEPKDRIIH
ncbi:MAG: putative quinol monooxygenase [Pseudomonadota bacterium]